MQFLYNSPSEISSGFPPVSVVTEELLHANSIYNESVELFDRLKHSNHCCQCEKRRPVKIATVVFLDEHFACSFPLSLCEPCSRLAPIVATHQDRPIYFFAAGMVLADRKSVV
jgi:hypothetical protein